jgi:hypothetical protein
VPNAGLARTRIADGDLLELHDFGTAGGMDANCVGHGAAPVLSKDAVAYVQGLLTP